MDLEFRQERITYLGSVLCETVMQEESGEAIVPDAMPDMERIADSFALVTLRGQECQLGTVSLSGDIQAGVLYMAQGEDKPRFLPVYLPFSLRRTVAGEALRLTAMCRVRSVEARMLNSRKLSVRVGLCIELDVLEPREELCCMPAKPERYVQMKCESFPMLLPAECAQKNLLLRETVPLGAGHSAAKLLHTDALCELTDEKLAGNRAVCKGNLLVTVLYETPEGALDSAALTLPFSLVTELEGEYEEQALSLCPVLTSLQAAPEGDGITVEAGLCMQCVVSRTLMVNAVTDAYATRGTLTLRWQDLAMRPRLDERALRQELRTEVPAQCAQVVRAEALPDVPQTRWQDDRLRVCVPVLFRVLYRDSEGAYQSAEHRAELNAEIPAADRRCRVSAWAEGCVFAAPAAGGIELRLSMALRCEWYADAELRAVCGAEYEPGERAQDEPAVIIRTPETDVPLWDVAKELCTTVSAIRLANDMEGDTAPAGELLLIPIVA